MFYLFLFIIISIHKIGCQVDENQQVVTDCGSKYAEIDKCSNDYFCIWIQWNPPGCFNICELMTEKDCDTKWECGFINGQCTNQGCAQSLSEDRCIYNIACTWEDKKCVDETCLVLNAKQNRDCPGTKEYCVWNERRQLCYDKRCSQYSTMQLCQEIFRCEWAKYKCINVQNSDL